MTTLVLLAGLGADERLFEQQRAAFADVVVVQPWIDPLDDEDLCSYAARVAALVAAAVDRRRPLLIGGSSFGGMVALEMARVLKPDGVVLLGSARDLSGVHPLWRPLLPLARLAPLWAHRLFARLGPVVARPLFGADDDDVTRLFSLMLRDSPPARVQWACRALASWRPQPFGELPIFSIHGHDDRLLPAQRAGADVVVDGAGHLLPLTHGAAVNAFLRDVLARFPH